MVSGFCHHCNQNVLLRREEFDVCLAIILLLFTAGIGFIIYLAVYYSKPEDRCIHCGNRIALIESSQYSQQNVHNKGIPKPVSSKPSQEEIQIIDEPIYCAFCGDKLSTEENYCPNCGSKK
ncbi:MAG: hypothetical protein ACFFBP_05910 [Promethearchaeota archaeon]